jgi:hypothetical protein
MCGDEWRVKRRYATESLCFEDRRLKPTATFGPRYARDVLKCNFGTREYPLNSARRDSTSLPFRGQHKPIAHASTHPPALICELIYFRLDLRCRFARVDVKKRIRFLVYHGLLPHQHHCRSGTDDGNGDDVEKLLQMER